MGGGFPGYHAAMERMPPLSDREVLLELTPFGQYMRVVAVDTLTLTEVSIQGPKTAPRALLEANALRRLEYVLRKNGHI